MNPELGQLVMRLYLVLEDLHMIRRMLALMLVGLLLKLQE